MAGKAPTILLMLLGGAVGGLSHRMTLFGEETATPAPQPIPRVAPTDPRDAVETFQTLHGFRMELLAHEPLVTDPVAMAYDENGLAYVVEMNDYPHVDKQADVPFAEQTAQPPLSRVRVLKDTDGDGRFDKSFLFAENLSWGAGIAVWKGGVFVAATPDIWYLKDTDGDHRADIRKKVFTGFRKFNVQAVLNNLAWGLDQKIYGGASGNGGMVRPADRPQAEAVRIHRRDFRFDPAGGGLEVISGGARFGNTFDDWGNRYLCNIRNPAQHVVLPDRYLQRNPLLAVRRTIHDCAESGDQLPVYPISPPEKWRELRARILADDTDQVYPRDTFAGGFVTSSSGITIYRGSAYPAAFHGNAFVAEVAGNLFYRQTLSPDGVTFAARRPDEKTEIVRSSDNWFRPVNFVNAPDGTLHVLDMYREFIEHPWSVPDELRAVLDFRSGCDRGRIYRLAPPGFEPPPPPKLGESTPDELVACLESPNAWRRETAHRLIFERQDRAAVEPLRRLLRESKSALGRVHALWSLAGLDALGDAEIAVGLGDADARVREHAVRLAEPRLNGAPKLLESVLKLAGDASVRVRFQVAFTLGEVADDRAVGALAEIAGRDVADPWVQTAVLSSVASRADRLLVALLNDRRFASQEAGWPWLGQLALIVAAREADQDLDRVLSSLTDADRGAQLAVIAGLGSGLRRTGKRLARLTTGGGAAARMIKESLAQAANTARDRAVAPAVRVQAIELLSHAKFGEVQQALGELLDAREPQAVQLAAVSALAGYRVPQVAGILLRRWRSYTPPVRGEAAEALLSRGERTAALLDAIEAGRVSPAHITLNQRRLLLNRGDAALRKRAAALLGRETLGPRKEVIARYRAALSLAGDIDRGRKVFEKECAACHRHEGQGNDIGPDFATIQHRTPDDVLVNLLDPNRDVSPDYLEYVVELSDGRVATGIIAAETATSMTLRRPQNVEQTVLRREIEQIAGTGKSIMPEGLEKNVSVQEMADLLAFLLQRPTPGEKP